MLIKESQLNTTQNPYRLLESIDYISDNISPAMVPVIESSRLNGYIINLDDIRTFGESSGIEDLGQCFGLICEANQIDESKVRFSVDGYKLLEDDSLTDIVAALISEGVEVYQKPLDPTNSAYIISNEAINTYIDEGSTELFEAFLVDDVKSILLEMSKRSAKKAERKLAIAKATGDTDAVEAITHRTNSALDKGLPGDYRPGSGNFVNRSRRNVNDDPLEREYDTTTSRFTKLIGIHPSLRHKIKELKNIKDPFERKKQMNAISDMNSHLKSAGVTLKSGNDMLKEYEKAYHDSDREQILSHIRKSNDEDADRKIKDAEKIGLKNFNVSSIMKNPNYLEQSYKEQKENAKKWDELKKTQNAEQEKVKAKQYLYDTHRKAISDFDKRENKEASETRKNDLLKTLSGITSSIDTSKLDPNQKKRFDEIQRSANNGDNLDQNKVRKLIRQAKSISNVVKANEARSQRNTNSHQTNNTQSNETENNKQSGSTNDSTVKQVEQVVHNTEKAAEKKPKSWLAQKIYALRQLYAKWLKKKNEEKDQGKIGFFSNILRIITKGIDFLLKKLQNFVD